MFQLEFAVGFCDDAPEVFIATRPNGAVIVAIDNGKACDARIVDDAPLHIVVVEQSFEIGKIDGAVIAGYDIEIAVVGFIVL